MVSPIVVLLLQIVLFLCCISGLLVMWNVRTIGVPLSTEPPKDHEPSCICAGENNTRPREEKRHKEHGEHGHKQNQHTSCDSVDISRKFYHREPKPDPSYFNETGYWVPNIVHFIWYSDTPKPFRFNNMLSVMSAHRYIKPDVILFHTNMEPTGEYWANLLALPSFRVVKKDYTLCFNDHLLKEPTRSTDASDIDRLTVLSENGGIYLDLDVIVVRSFDPLRRFPCTVGTELIKNEKVLVVCGAVVICSRQSQFLHFWLQSFIDDYRQEMWAYNSGRVPTILWQKYPDLVHVEKTSFFRPAWFQLDQIFLNKPYDWKEKNYLIHLWNSILEEKKYIPEPTFENIRTWNGTFGEIARYVLYGSPDVISPDDKRDIYITQ